MAKCLVKRNRFISCIMNVKWLCLYCDFSVSKVCVKVVCVADGKTCQQPSFLVVNLKQTGKRGLMFTLWLSVCSCVCRDPFSEFLRAHSDSGHWPRFSSLLRHPGPEIPGEPFESSWGLPEVPRRWHPQAHYRERLAGTQFFLLFICLQYATPFFFFFFKDWSWLDTNVEAL